MGHLYNFGNVGMPPECSCPDFTEWNIPCKHFSAIFRLFPQWGWNKLPDHYLNGPYMSSDQTTINTFFDTCNSHDSCSSEQTTFHDDIPSQMDNIPKKVYFIKKCNVRIYCLSLAGIKCVSCSYEFKNYFGRVKNPFI